jgi:NADH-quinone oxidoreductase subunit L
MMRLVSLTFFGENRASDHVRHHIHESPATMTVPLVVLAALSVVGGWIGWPHFLGGANTFERWLEPVFAGGAGEAAAHGAAAAGEVAVHGGAVVAHAGGAGTEWLLMGLSLAIAAAGLAAGWWVYGRRPQLADRWRGLGRGLPYRLLANKYFVDEAYDAALIRPGFAFSRRVLWRWVDAGLIDGLLVNGSALAVAVTGAVLRLAQNGMLRFYAWAFAVGATAFVLYLTIRS